MGDLEEIEKEIIKTEKSIKRENRILTITLEQNAKTDKQISSSEEKIRKKKRDLEILISRKSRIFGIVFASTEKQEMDINADIFRLETDIDNLKKSKISTTFAEISIQALKDKLNGLRMRESLPGRVWPSYPEALNEKVKNEYLDLFMQMSNSFNRDINLILLGETGSGKSSFLNACQTALANSKTLTDTYRVSTRNNLRSTTTSLHLVELKIQANVLPVRFYDCPGITEDETIGQEEVDMILNGEVKENTEIKVASEMRKDETKLRINPGFGDIMHCIIYVVRATSNLDVTATHSLRTLKEIHQKRNKEDSPRAFALVTAIDEIGVPNTDIENMYRYPCAKKICQKVSKVLDIPLTNVLPMSNYFEESASTTPKNCMALLNMWKMVSSGKAYVESFSAKRNASQGFYEGH